MKEEGKGHIYGSLQGSSMETTWNYRVPLTAVQGWQRHVLHPDWAWTPRGGQVHSPCWKLEVLSWCSRSFPYHNYPDDAAIPISQPSDAK